MTFNKQILQVETSKIRQFNDFARSIGCDYYMTMGEPDFFTPENITDRAIESMKAHETKYGPTPGILPLRKKISEFEEKFNGIHYDPEEILIIHGSTEGLTSALFSILNDGDEVIIFNPAFPMYRQIVEFARGKVVPVDICPTSFQITKEQLQNAITEKTKCLILTSPNNPTGTILNDESLQNVYEAVKGKDIFIICDDVYNQIVFTERKPGFCKYQDLHDQIIICQSYSKSYAMPGWRCGYMMGSKEFIEQAVKIHQDMIVALNTFIQPAMIEALDYDNTAMVETYKERRDYIYGRLIKMGLECVLPEGAFYIFPSIKKYGLTSMEFCEQFAEKYKAAIIPGICFEADDYVRLSYCVSPETIRVVLDRLELFLHDLESR